MIFFGTICRNIEPEFNMLHIFVRLVHEMLPDAHIFIYENNSTDNTKQLLGLLEQIDTKIHIQSEDISIESQLESSSARTWDNKPCRMESIAIARNKLLDMIIKENYSDTDTIVFFDSDMAALPTMEQLMKYCLEFPKDKDVIFANGLNRNRKTYYDMYAIRYMNQPLGPEIVGEKFWKQMPSLTIQEPTPVYSAFGGLAIYRGAAIKGCRYSGIPTKELDMVNRMILNTIAYTQPKPQTHHEGSLLGVYLYGLDGLYYYNNSGYNYPIICEHSAFHATMWMNGFRRFTIDPALVYYSTH